MSRKIQVLLFLFALSAMFSATVGAAGAPVRQVNLTIGTETVNFHTTAATVLEFLESESIYLNPKDMLNLDLDATLNVSRPTALHLRRSFTINITIDGGETFEYEVGPIQRVGHILAELRKEKGVEFTHNGFLNDTIVPGSTLHLYTRSVEELVLTVNMPFEREIRTTTALAPGDMTVLQQGVLGELTTVVHVFFVNGVEVERTVVSMTQTRRPVREIIISGTSEDVPRPTREVASNDLEPGTIMSVSGNISGYDYIFSKIVESTAYSAQQPGLSNYTASGHRAVRGVIAVDPSVIPLGTRVYVEGYGRALASDTGSAIRGYKIDLCFDTVAEALQHGRRNVRIWILRDEQE